MNALFQKFSGGLANWFGNGPWRSKSVLAAIAAVVIGLGFWVSDIKNSPPQNETDPATTNAPAITALDPTSPPPVGAHWNWGKPFPGYVRMGASYVAAYCIGWLFRRLIRLILLAGALGLALLGFGKLAGWDMTRPQEQLNHSADWARHEANAERDYFKGLLPSATAGGIGMFMGFRRRNKVGGVTPRREAES